MQQSITKMKRKGDIIQPYFTQEIISNHSNSFLLLNNYTAFLIVIKGFYNINCLGGIW